MKRSFLFPKETSSTSHSLFHIQRRKMAERFVSLTLVPFHFLLLNESITVLVLVNVLYLSLRESLIWIFYIELSRNGDNLHEKVEGKEKMLVDL